MAIIYNSELTNNIVKTIKGSTARDKMPNEIAEKVLPVIDVNPRPKITANILKRAVTTNTTSVTIYTTPTTKDFYLTACCLSYYKTAGNPGNEASIRVTVGGATIRPVEIRSTASVADQQTVTQIFNPPIKIDRGTNITANVDDATATISQTGCIQGYEIEE